MSTAEMKAKLCEIQEELERVRGLDTSSMSWDEKRCITNRLAALGSVEGMLKADLAKQDARSRPVAIALVEAFDRSMTRDDLRDMDDDELRRFTAAVYHWEQLADREKDRRRAGRP